MPDRARQVLAQGVPPGVRRSYHTLADHGGVPYTTLYCRDHGRPSIEEKAESQQYLYPWEEKALVKFLLQMSDLGHPVRIKYIPQIAFGATSRRPTADRPLKPPNKNWPKALEMRHPELKSRRVRALDWNRHEKNTSEKIPHWFEVIGLVLQHPKVRPWNVFNMDETGTMLSMPGSVKVLVGKDDMRDYRGARVKRTTITAIECISAEGRYLNPMIIWPATTHRSNWTTFATPGWQYACTEKGYTDSEVTFEWLKRIFDPETRERANGEPRVLIWDGFGTHETLEILEFCFENNIILCRLPSHTSHKLQPCDVAVFGPLKAAYRDEVDRLERAGTNTIGKEHFTSLYSPARERALTKKNILAGFAKCGLVPFNPDRVLQDIPKPPAELTVQKVDESKAHALDKTSKQSLERYVQKLTKATQTFFTQCVLQRKQIQFLTKMNDESKVRRSTKSEVLGKAKVMSYEDLKDEREKRAKKVAAKKAKGKGKRGPKPKKSTSAEEASADEGTRLRKRKNPPEANPPEASSPEPKAKKVRMSEASEPWKAPVARMSEMQDVEII